MNDAFALGVALGGSFGLLIGLVARGKPWQPEPRRPLPPPPRIGGSKPPRPTR